MLDLILAIAHHVLVFCLAGVLAAELTLVNARMGAAEVRRLTMIDVAYGALAGVIVAVGVMRVLFAAKGVAYYGNNWAFWSKMATFVAVGLLSLWPTTRYINWQRTLREGGPLPAPVRIREVQVVLWVQAALFAAILGFAAAMARGYGISTKA